MDVRGRETKPMLDNVVDVDAVLGGRVDSGGY